MRHSATTATLLGGATYHILSNPVVLKKLQAEIRDAFQSEDEITAIAIRSPGKLPYMEAVLTESLHVSAHPSIIAAHDRVNGRHYRRTFCARECISFHRRSQDQNPVNLVADIRRSSSVSDLPIQRQFHRAQVLRSRAMATRRA